MVFLYSSAIFIYNNSIDCVIYSRKRVNVAESGEYYPLIYYNQWVFKRFLTCRGENLPYSTPLFLPTYCVNAAERIDLSSLNTQPVCEINAKNSFVIMADCCICYFSGQKMYI